ncbi:MAG: NTPase [Anaerolineae bacterium]|jgi:nucleoside-triphosphatase
MVGQALLLTGRPGVGKTTVIRQVVARLGQQVGGFYTQEVRAQGRRTGFRLVALDGPVGTLASVNGSGRSRVGKYMVHRHDLERVGVGALRRALAQPQVQVVVIDEIGKMELFSPAFRRAVVDALASPKAVLGTVMAGPEPWADALKARPDVTLVEVTRDNRDKLAAQILVWLEGVGLSESAQW